MVMMMVTLEAQELFTVEQDGQVTTWQPGERKTLSLKHARQVAERVGRKKVRVLHGCTRDLQGVKEDITSIQLGDRVAWQRPDNFMAIGEVECLHVDNDRILWAFVALPDETWAVVNLQCAQRIDEDA